MFLIAEAGINHNGDFKTALQLVDMAKWAGADAVKFQMFSSQKLWGDDRIKKYELTREQFKTIHAYCNSAGIEFMCTPFGVEELEFLTPMLKRIKIASGCTKRKPLIDAAIKTGLPIILSTGMSTLEETKEAIIDIPKDRLTLLHCTSSYPCRLEDVNLRAMVWLLGLGSAFGYSDHTNGITTAIAATAFRASVIEKHFTLDRNQEGPDHKSSITPKEFKGMQLAIIEVEAALGDGVKRVMPSEMKLKEAWHGQ